MTRYPSTSASLGTAPFCVGDAGSMTSDRGEPAIPPDYAEARSLDPLGLDGFLADLPDLAASRRLDMLLNRLDGVVADFRVDILKDTSATYACLRDLDFILCACQVIQPRSYKSVARLEDLLAMLGRAAKHVPRGCNFTYGLFNPSDGRMRTFTASPDERIFIGAIQSGTRDLDDALLDVQKLTQYALSTAEFLSAAARLAVRFDSMVAAVRDVRAGVRPEFFSGTILRYLCPLDIDGQIYPAVSGALVQNVAIDYLLFGIGIEDSRYVGYVEGGLAAMLPFHTVTVRQCAQQLAGVSLLIRLKRERPVVGTATGSALAALGHLDVFLTSVLAFRAAHRRLAAENMPLRPLGLGSGGYDMALLDLLINRTRQARSDVREMLTHD